VFDLDNNTLLFREVVAHGQGTRRKHGPRFLQQRWQPPEQPGPVPHWRDHQGGNGYSLRMQGLEPGTNGRGDVGGRS
jgi:hypothetical protein